MKWYKKERGLKKAIIQGTWTLMFCSILIHIATCGWIYVGRHHNDEEAGLISWMYLESSDGDYFRNVSDKSIYQQLIDKETSVGQIYSYAIFYVMTVFTTVGYGSHSYDQT